ncbi:hypothetical protein ACFE04_020546 [Oxalis oulophora]
MTSMISMVQEEQNPNDDVFTVTFYGHDVKVTVTDEPSVVTSWINKINNIHVTSLKCNVIGLDIEWRPNYGPHQNPVAIIQLCAGNLCLIFQILRAREVPQSLKDLFKSQCHVFVGVGIGEDIEKLIGDYDLGVQNMVELRDLAANLWGRREVKQMGLAKLTSEAMGIEFVGKPKRVTMGRWDNSWLTYDQVMYACVDAFMSFQTGFILNAAQGFNCSCFPLPSVSV